MCPGEWTDDRDESVPESVPDEWTTRYADRRSNDPWAERLAEIERNAQREMRLLIAAAAMCGVVLLVALGWATLALVSDVDRAAVGAGVILAAFGICLWQVHRALRQHRRRQGPDSFG